MIKYINKNEMFELWFKYKKIIVRVENAKNKALSYRCGKCGYFDFEKNSIDKIIIYKKLTKCLYILKS